MVLKSFINPERKSSDKVKKKRFDYECTQNSTKYSVSELGEEDVVFLVDKEVFRGHQRVFSDASMKLKCCFDALNKDIGDPSMASVTIDAPVECFEAVFNFCYTKKLSVPIALVPSVYKLSKTLQIDTLQAACAEYLAAHLSGKNIGEISNMVSFTSLITDGSFEDTAPADIAPTAESDLTKAVLSFIRTNADMIACSLTGQLGARLIVNLTRSLDSLVDRDLESNGSKPLMNESVVSAILLWAHQRICAGERLAQSGNQENVQSDDEESDGTGNGTGSALYGPRAQNRRKTKELISCHRRSSKSPQGYTHQARGLISAMDNKRDAFEPNEVELKPVKIEPSRIRLPTQDIRISLDLDELSNFIFETPSSSSEQLTSCPSEGFQSARGSCIPSTDAEFETCLLSPTSLGVGTTSIWLGKLAGHLVSLSVKVCQPQQLGSSASTSTSDLLYMRHSLDGWDCQSSSASDPSPVNSSEDHFQTMDDRSNDVAVDDDELAATVTASSSIRLAMAVHLAQSSRSSTEHLCHLRVGLPVDPDRHEYPIRMLEARSGAGIGLLPVVGDQDYIVLAGGYTRKGCLDSVELYTHFTGSGHPGFAGLNAPVRGPWLSKPRGRLAVAQTRPEPHSGVLYACGGSTGSVDLDSVERLTSSALHTWLSSPELIRRQPKRHGLSTASGCAWQPVAKLQHARSSPSAVGLDGLVTGPLISQSNGSIVVLGGVLGTAALNTAEAYIPELDQWVRLPNMHEGRSEAACAVLASKNLLVVAGGSNRNDGQWLIEALDLRTPNWISLPSFVPGGHNRLRGATLVPSPDGTDSLLLAGGFNGQDTLGRTWLFDPDAWQWIRGPSLLTARSNACAFSWPDQSVALVFGGFGISTTAVGFLDSIELISTS